jgi:hypothetical protein
MGSVPPGLFPPDEPKVLHSVVRQITAAHNIHGVLLFLIFCISIAEVSVSVILAFIQK